MNVAFDAPRSRPGAAALVLLLHGAVGVWWVQVGVHRAPEATRVTLNLIRQAPEPRPAMQRPRPEPPLVLPSRVEVFPPGPSAPTREAPALGVEAPPAAPAAPPMEAEPQRPLDLRLPSSGARVDAAPSLQAQIRADARANSPREGAEARMAHALGGAGWRTIDLGDGAKKVMGPFGECYISRPSLVNEVPGHPLAGLVPDKIFGCGGIEKGSLKHERPK